MPAEESFAGLVKHIWVLSLVHPLCSMAFGGVLTLDPSQLSHAISSCCLGRLGFGLRFKVLQQMDWAIWGFLASLGKGLLGTSAGRLDCQ